MKRNLIALLIVALVTAGLFAFGDPGAGDPGGFIGSPDLSSSFNVTTTISAINEMKLTAGALSGTPATLSGVTAFEGPVNVKADGTTEAFSAYITTLSNNRKGYTVTMKADPMKSTDAVGTTHTYINYKVTAGGVDYTTSVTNPPDAVTVITQGALTALSGQSKQISLSVIATEFAAAVEGEYIGTVTFEYTSAT